MNRNEEWSSIERMSDSILNGIATRSFLMSGQRGDKETGAPSDSHRPSLAATAAAHSARYVGSDRMRDLRCAKARLTSVTPRDGAT